MRGLYKNLKKYYYIEHEVVGYGQNLVPILEYTVWHGRFITIQIGRRRFTILYGLDFTVFNDPKRATEHLIMQKNLYKHAVRNKWKK